MQKYHAAQKLVHDSTYAQLKNAIDRREPMPSGWVADMERRHAEAFPNAARVLIVLGSVVGGACIGVGIGFLLP